MNTIIMIEYQLPRGIKKNNLQSIHMYLKKDLSVIKY